LHQTINSFPGREIVIKGEKHLYFGGTSYLGLQMLPAFQELFAKKLQQYGTNYGASRNANIQIAVFEKVEAHLAKMTGSPSCVTLSSGYLAGQFVSQFFQSEKCKSFYAPNTHTALYQKGTTAFSSYQNLNKAIRKQLKKQPQRELVVFLDSIDFSGGNYPLFNDLKILPLEALIVVVDDSHGIGIVGDKGGGIYESLANLHPRELIVSSSLGKGFGVQAGAVLGTIPRINQLKRTPFFGGASPAAPAAMATLLAATTIYDQRRLELQQNITLFHQQLQSTHVFTHMPLHPAFSFKDEALSAYLAEEKIIVTNFYYPSETKELMSKIIISAAHTPDDINRITQCINNYLANKKV